MHDKSNHPTTKREESSIVMNPIEITSLWFMAGEEDVEGECDRVIVSCVEDGFGGCSEGLIGLLIAITST